MLDRLHFRLGHPCHLGYLYQPHALHLLTGFLLILGQLVEGEAIREPLATEFSYQRGLLQPLLTYQRQDGVELATGTHNPRYSRR